MPSSPSPQLNTLSSASISSSSSTNRPIASSSRNPLPPPIVLPPSSIVDLTLSPSVPGPTAAQKGKGRAPPTPHHGQNLKRPVKAGRSMANTKEEGSLTVMGKKRRLVPKPPDDGAEEAEGVERLEEYNCPICFSPPKNAVTTPCGHLLCQACLHTSLLTALIRSGSRPPPAPALPPSRRERAFLPIGSSSSAGQQQQRPPLNLAGACPVCRLPLPGGERGEAAVPKKKATRWSKGEAVKAKEGARMVWLKVIEADKEVVQL